MFPTPWLCNVGVVWCSGLCDLYRHIRFEDLLWIMLLVRRWAFLRLFSYGCFLFCLCDVRLWIRLYKSFARVDLDVNQLHVLILYAVFVPMSHIADDLSRTLWRTSLTWRS